MVTATSAIGVEIRFFDAVGFQILRSGRATGDIAGRGDVVGGDRIAQQGKHPSRLDRRDGCRLHAHTLKVGWVTYIGRIIGPGVKFAGGDFDLAPVCIACENVTVTALEHF